jgi:chaperonin GroEL
LTGVRKTATGHGGRNRRSDGVIGCFIHRADLDYCRVRYEKALSSPVRQIALNAGEDGSIVVGKILGKEQYAFGYDAQAGGYGNLIQKGIIDPTKVVRTALQDAASVAGLLITTEAMVAELPKPPPPPLPGHGHGPHHDDMEF